MEKFSSTRKTVKSNFSKCNTKECENLRARVQEPLKFYSNSYLKRHDVKELRVIRVSANEPKTYFKLDEKNGLGISSITTENDVKVCQTDEQQQQQEIHVDYPRYGLPHAISAIKTCCDFDDDDDDMTLEKKMKSQVDQALKLRKIFLIRGHLPQLASILNDRGWIQMFQDAEPNRHAANVSRHSSPRPNFIWDCHNDFVEWDLRSMDANVLLNRLKNPAVYTSKLGMADILREEVNWLYEENVADVLYPRSYNPSRELEYFVRDFKRCAALALLKRFVNSTSPTCLQQPQQQELISMDQILFALKQCENYIDEIEHKDIDNDANDADEEWPTSFSQRLSCYATAQLALENLKNIDPQFELNGEQNLWIVKPSALCCGSGIFITHQLDIILNRVKSKPKDYYVIQKYIERPLLVHGTKFDIRQWFLVTSTFPLTIWSYREALLRFSSKPYTTRSYHAAIHLCNTAVQEKYNFEQRKKHQNEDERCIRDEEWDCEKLNEYLKSVVCNDDKGEEPYWDRIYPKMTQAIVLTMLAAQDFMDRRACSFELYGADFMVMEDLSVWLIEINTNPRMHPPSSKITQRLYSSVLDGLIKVVLDRPQRADVGNFELIYEQQIPESHSYMLQRQGPCFFAYGKSMQLHENE